MTENEAIEILKGINAPRKMNRKTVDVFNAIDLVIKALETQPCDVCISRAEVLDVIERELFKWDVIDEVRKLPSVTPQPKTGQWIDVGIEGLVFECSICGTKKTIESHFCPNCGAKMTESEDKGGGE